jgi:polysaccharide biosynthesis transport protein
VQPCDAGIPEPTVPVPTPRRLAPLGPVAGRINTPTAFPPRGETHNTPPGLATGPDAGLLLRALGRRWLVALGLGMALAGGAAAVGWKLLAPKHMAFTNVRIASRGVNPFIDRSEARHEFNTYLKTQASQLHSRTVLNAALARDEIRRLNLERRFPDVAQWLEDELKIEFQPDNEFIRISLSHDDPEEAKLIINGITSAYLKEHVDKEEAKRSDAVSQLDRLYTEANNRLRTKNANLKALLKELDTPDLPANRIRQQILQDDLSGARSRLGQTLTQLLQAQTRLAALEAQGKNLDKPLPAGLIDEALSRHPTLRAEEASVERVKMLMKGMEANLRDPTHNPRYSQARALLHQLEERMTTRRKELRKEVEQRARRQMKAEHETRLAQSRTEVEPLRQTAEAQRTEVRKLAEQAQKIGSSSAEADNLKQETEREGKFVADYGKRLEMAKLDLLSKQRVTVPQEAALLASDIKKQLLGTVLAAGASLFAACFGVAWWEFRRRRIQSPEEVVRSLGLRVVGAVPASPDVEMLINASAEEQEGGHDVLDSVDAIRTMLLRSYAETSRVLMVTSAGVGEGKTTLASHLASSLSRAGRKTLLIDGDLRQPAVHQLFEVPLQPGLSEVLLGEVDTVDTILPTNQDGLLVMAAGEWDREVIQALARGGAQGVLEKLKEEFDFVVVDSHPVLVANDSLLIGQSADAVILSVLRDVSQTPKVYAAMQRLQSLGIRVLGAVVNGTDPDEAFVPTQGYSTAAA